jgi:hypothetical protein
MNWEMSLELLTIAEHSANLCMADLVVLFYQQAT